MAYSETGLYVIAYDIANPKRLSRIHRFLKKQGLPMQYSVFTLVIKHKPLLRLLDGITKLINKREDDVRCYRLPKDSKAITLGKQIFPADVMLLSNGINQLL